MEIIHPPTDSLYKFCALTGLSIIFLSYYFPLTLAHDLDSNISLLEVKVAKGKVEKQYLQKEIDRYQQLIENSIHHKTAEQSEKEGKLPITWSEQEIKEKDVALRKALKDLEMSTVEMDLDTEASRRLLNQLYLVRTLAWVGIISGLLLARYGFKNWYERVQIFQDAILKHEAEHLAKNEP